MKRNLKGVLGVVLMTGLLLVGCGNASDEITVVTREDGSGTRGAFVELFGVEEKDAGGNKVDHTTDEANTIQSTSVMMTTIAGSENAIGYISLGSMNDTIKAVKIDGAEASAANIKAGTYKVSRPFNIATKENVSPIAQDFINFILSIEGQNVVEAENFIANDGAKPYSASGATGKIVVAGSSSVTPVMEKLKEAYLKLNTGAEIEVQQSDSSTGISAAIDGTCHIGMASRELKDSEIASGIKGTVIATDGIVVIVNKNSSIDNLTKDQVKAIYTGEITNWSEIEK